MISQTKAFEELKAVCESMLNGSDALTTFELVEDMMLAYKRQFWVPAAYYRDAAGRWIIEARRRGCQPQNLYNDTAVPFTVGGGTRNIIG